MQKVTIISPKMAAHAIICMSSPFQMRPLVLVPSINCELPSLVFFTSLNLLFCLSKVNFLANLMAANRALVLVLFLLVLQGVSGCFPGQGCFHAKEAQSRKMLQAELKENNEVVKGTSLHGSTSSNGNRENPLGWELRTVPSGPDPLHHNGGSPKKPRIDP